MILRPSRASHRVIGKYTGVILVGLGLLMLVPLGVAVAYGEWSAVFDFAISFALCMIVGFGAQAICRTDRDLTWAEGLVVAAGSWLWAMLLAALPLYLSGHFGSYVDACFDAMSGFTTSGLLLLQDLDHLSISVNTWRHLVAYAGGQGIVVIALTFLFKATAGAYKMYVGEGKDERLLPNVVQTARAIWLVSIVYLVVGSLVCTVNNFFLGMRGMHAFFVALWQFCGSWSTCGFAPYSYNALYYHSLSAEVILIIIFVAGSLNFALHWALWTGKRNEVWRNIELIAFTTSVLVFTTMCAFGLAKAGVYPDFMSLARKTIFLVASAHTGTGASTIYARSFVNQWGSVGMLAITLAMMMGGSAASTAGGIKGIRLGIIFKAIGADIRKIIMPEAAMVRTKYHHIRDSYLTDNLVKSALTIVTLFVITYTFSGIIGTLYGYDFLPALFEGTSALATVGFSCGITSPTMPEGLKIAYIMFMWLGRLEFMGIFAICGYAYAVVRGR